MGEEVGGGFDGNRAEVRAGPVRAHCALHGGAGCVGSAGLRFPEEEPSQPDHLEEAILRPTARYWITSTAF